MRDSTVSLHHRYIQTLVTEMFKVKNELPPEIICDISPEGINNHYSLRNINHFKTSSVRTANNGTECLISWT